MGNVAGVTSTLSKHPALFSENAPQRLVKAQGAKVWGEDGREFTDWISGLLSVLLGHNHPEVTEAVTKHLRDGGPTWSLPHLLEEEVAASICRLIGHPDWQVRFVKTGSEACAGAVRIARAVTGRDHVESIGYHGWHDTLLTTPPAWGVPVDTDGTLTSHPFNSGWTIGEGTAAAILEPVTLEEPDPDYLRSLRAVCTTFGALLIADECITGGRYPEWSAMRHYGVEPDLYVFSKALANGYPLAAIVGRPELMGCFDVDWRPDYVANKSTGPVYVSGTWSTETVGLAAAKAALAVWERERVAARHEAMGLMLRYQLARQLDRHQELRVRLKGPSWRTALECDTLDVKTALMARMIDAGHLVGTGFNLTAAHTLLDVEGAAEAFGTALEHLAAPAGRPVVSPYRQG